MIIIINGSINSGKTTVAGLLVEMIPKTAHVEIDSLREFIRWLPLEEAIPINLENAVSVANNLLKRGLHVVVTYPLSPEEHEYLTSNLKGVKGDIYTFTLSPTLSVALTNRGTRELTSKEQTRIREQYTDGRKSLGMIIDNSHQTPEETTKAIVDHIAQKQ